MDSPSFQQALIAIQAEFVDMPELRLSVGQLARVGMLPTDVCKAAVSALVATGFLVEAANGSFSRRGTPPVQVEHLDVLTWAVTPAACRGPMGVKPDGCDLRGLSAV